MERPGYAVRARKEILIAETADDVLRYLAEISNEERRAIGARARERILAAHTPQQRASQLESYYSEAASSARSERIIMTVLLLIRHAETDAVENRITGWLPEFR